MTVASRSSVRRAQNLLPLGAAVFSAVIPGAGQIVAGARRRGIKLLIINLELIVILALLARDRVAVLSALVDPTALSWMMVVNIALLAYRLWAANDAYWIARGPEERPVGYSRGMAVAGGVLAGLILISPHVAFGAYNLTQYNLITEVFAADDLEVPTVGESASDSNASGDGAAAVAAPAIKLWDGLERLNVLLLGGDFGEGRKYGIRTDTIMVVSLDPASGDVALFSIPRNWTQVPLPEGYGVWDCNCYPELINEVWIQGDRYPDAFPGPGTPNENAIKAVVSEFLGIPIHYYAMVNLDGFVSLVDAFGGVEINVPNRIEDAEYPHEDGSVEQIVIEPGLQRLDGHLALAYARTRRTSNDYVRMARQRCVLEAMVEQADPATLLFRYPFIADVLQESISTDIPISRLPDFIELLPKIDTTEALNVRFIPPDYLGGYRTDGGVGGVANLELVHEHVRLVIDTPDVAAVALGLEGLDDTCDPTEEADAEGVEAGEESDAGEEADTGT